jgi:hypothetical protein
MKYIYIYIISEEKKKEEKKIQRTQMMETIIWAAAI